MLAARSILLGAYLATMACSCQAPARITPPTRLCVREAPNEPCRRPEDVEAMMRAPDLAILSSQETPAGRQRARILTVVAQTDQGPVRFRAKWRALSTSHGLNDPRKDLAAYAFQKLFLGPEEYVVPPTVGHCFDITDYRIRMNPKERASFPSVSCVYGTLSYWLEDAKDVADAEKAGWLGGSRLFDPQRFDQSTTYRRTIADVNLLDHIVGNGDTHPGQFVFTAAGTDPRVYCVDFTISFSPYRSPRLGPPDDWSLLHVPALPRESIDRLRRLQRSDVERLAVIEQYEIRKGQLVSTRPSAPAADLDAGLRWTTRGQLQAGLRTKEIAYAWDRIVRLRDALDRGDITVF